MPDIYTNPVIIKKGAVSDARKWLDENFDGNYEIVCDKNTESIANTSFPNKRKFVFEGKIHATDILAGKIIPEKSTKCLVACGSGSIHDLTRYAAHALKIPFVSFPTAPSVDGFVSNVAAMTVDGRKVTYPSTPPIALFADSEVYRTAPNSLTVSGVGDIVGKYISLFDWQFTCIITNEKINKEIFSLEEEAVKKVMSCDKNSEDYIDRVMECLVLSGIAIQMMGSSRPASGAEHHLSHLWEMNCINDNTDALHGEKVGVSSLLVLEKYKSLKRIIFKPKSFSYDYLNPVYGVLTRGIIAENTPSSLDGVSQKKIDKHENEILTLIDSLPQVDEIKNYYKLIGAKSTLSELNLPDTAEFISKSLEFAPYVRDRLTLLKVI